MQGRYSISDSALNRAAEVAIKECLGIQPQETVLIITNCSQEVNVISRALYNAAAEAEARPTMVVQPRKSQLEFAEQSVYAAIAANPEVVISISEEKLGKDRRGVQSPYAHGVRSYDSVFHYLLYGKKSIRAFWSPRVTREIFKTTVPIDYGRLRRHCRLLLPLLDEADGIEIRSPRGTELFVGLAGRKAKADDGDFSRPGLGGNLPAGEVFISPAVGTAEGRIVFDGSVASADGVMLVRNVIEAEVKKGFVKEVRGGREAETLLASITRAEEQCRTMEAEGSLPQGQGEVYARNTRHLGELGIGLNPAATILGNMLCDEKVRGTCHLAIGYNYDEDAPALIHLDGLIKAPTLTIILPGGRRQVIMEEGKFSGEATFRASGRS
ncbi:MAG: peptidase M17 [Spirochaetaceae bacterium]|nr:MAG: peptidase M17 [Spirochaetaceae bacterium]